MEGSDSTKIAKSGKKDLKNNQIDAMDTSISAG